MATDEQGGQPGRATVALIPRKHSTLWVAIDSYPNGGRTLRISIEPLKPGQHGATGAVSIQPHELAAFQRAIAKAEAMLKNGAADPDATGDPEASR